MNHMSCRFQGKQELQHGRGLSACGWAAAVAIALCCTGLLPVSPARAADAAAIAAEVTALQTKVQAGDPTATFDLATLEYVGIGVVQDYIGAVDLLKQASAGGNAEAGCELGFLYQTGSFAQGPPPPDPAQAEPWYKTSAARGNPWGEFALAAFYRAGLGLKTERTRSAALFAQAAAQGVTADPTTFPLQQLQRHFYDIAYQLTGTTEWVDVVSRAAGGDN
jgi:TPR repeat protein